MNVKRLKLAVACLLATEAAYLSSSYSTVHAAALEEVVVTARKREESQIGRAHV